MIKLMNVKKKIIIKYLNLIKLRYCNIYDNMYDINFFNKDNIYLLDNNYIDLISQLYDMDIIHEGAGDIESNNQYDINLIKKIKSLEYTIKIFLYQQNNLIYQKNTLLHQRNLLLNTLYLKNKDIESLQDKLKFILVLINNETLKLNNNVNSSMEDILNSLNNSIQKIIPNDNDKKDTLNINIEGTLTDLSSLKIDNVVQTSGTTKVTMNGQEISET